MFHFSSSFFLNKLEIAGILLFFNLFTIFCLRDVSVIFQKWKTQINSFSASFFWRFKRRCKIGGVILK